MYTDMGIEERVRLFREAMHKEGDALSPIKHNTYRANLNRTYGTLAVDAEIRKQVNEETQDDD